MNKGYAFRSEAHGTFTPEGRDDSLDVAAHNAAVEREELDYWAQQPDRWQVYVTKHDVGSQVTTWQGVPLGIIVRASRFATNMSRNIVALTIRGTNGAMYHGRYGAEWSQLCRVRRCS